MTVPTATIDRPIAETILIQRFGLWIFGQTLVRVTTSSNPQTTVGWMDSHPGVPNIGAAWSTDDDDLINLRLEEREAKVINTDGSSYRVDVKLIYRLQRRIESGGPELHKKAARGGGTLQQITTPLDINGAPIITKFTGSDGTVFPPKTAEVSMLRPQLVTTREVVIATNFPDEISSSWLGFVNIDTWNGEEKGRWLCVRADYEAVNVTSNPSLYAFVFEFMLAIDREVGHVYFAVYKDSKNQVPQGVTLDNGITKVDGHEARPFNSLF